MKEYNKRKLTRLQAYDYNNVGAYFLTICTKNRKCILSQIVGTGVLDCPKIKLTNYGIIAEKYINQLNEFYAHLAVESYVIMPNHIHIMLYIKEKEQSRTPVPTRANNAVSKFISTFKRFCNKEYEENIWQDRSYDHIIRDQKDYDEHLRYICENPDKWQEDKLFKEE